MFFNTKFILASSSQSRYKILKNIGLNFKVKKPTCNEEVLKKMLYQKKTKPEKLSLELARLKSKNISKTQTKDFVVGADTVIVQSGQILSKAKNFKEAKKKLMLMSGRWHYIYSSVSIHLNSKEVWSYTLKTKVKMRKINTKEIKTYLLESGKKILKSVGCYQVELQGPNIIKNIKGDFFNVMGFPLFPFLNFLERKKNDH